MDGQSAGKRTRDVAGTLTSLLTFSLHASCASTPSVCHVSLHSIGFLPVAPMPHGDQNSVVGTRSKERVPIKQTISETPPSVNPFPVLLALPSQGQLAQVPTKARRVLSFLPQ